MRATLVAVFLGLRFLLELALFAAWGWIGWHASDSTVIQVVLMVGLPVVVATGWGLALSPKARLGLPLAVRLVVEIALFAAAAMGLWAAGASGWGLALILGEAIVLGSLLALGRPPGPEATTVET